MDSDFPTISVSTNPAIAQVDNPKATANDCILALIIEPPIFWKMLLILIMAPKNLLEMIKELVDSTNSF